MEPMEQMPMTEEPMETYEEIGEEQAPQIDPSTFVDDEIRDMILKRKEASRTFYEPRKLMWDKCWNHYKQVYDKTNKESWQSTTFIPASPKIAEVIASNLHSALLGPDQPVEFQARGPQFESPVRDVNEIMSVDIERSELKVHETDILRSVSIIGTGIGKVEYIREYADVPIKERVKEIPGMATMRSILGLAPAPTETITMQRKIVKDFSSCKYVDRYNIFPEPGTTDICKDRWIIEEGKVCNYKLLELKNDPENPVINITEELLLNNPSDVDDPNGDKSEKDAALGEENKATAYMNPDQEHLLDEYWGPAPRWMVEPELYGKEEHKYDMVYAWFWLIDGQHVIRRQVTPFRDAEPPYEKGVYIRVPGQFDGIGPLEIVMGLQIELNERVNCQQDEINLKLSKPMAVVKEMISQGEYGRLKSGPGAVWLFSNTDDVKKAVQTIDFELNLGDSWRSIQWLLNEMQEASGAVKAVIGNDGGGGGGEAGTFRGQMLNKQVASERFIMNARLFETTALAGIHRKMYHRVYQYKSYEEVAKIIGEERAAKFEFISPEDLDVMSKVVPSGVTSMENKGIQLAQMAEEFKMFVQFPWYKQVEAARKIVTQGGQADPDTVIMSDEELGILNEQKRAALNEGMGAPPPPPGMPGEQPPGPIAGNVPGPTDGLPQPAMPPRGPGVSPMDVVGRPV